MKFDILYKTRLVFFPQSASGNTDSTLSGTDYESMKFSDTSALPAVRYTGFDIPSPAVEMRTREDIESETIWEEYESGKITPPQITLNAERPLDLAGIISKLQSLPVDDPFLGMFKVLRKNNEGSGYHVIYSAPALLMSDASFAGTARNKLTTQIKFQVTAEPTVGKTACNQTGTFSNGTWSFSGTSPNTNGSSDDGSGST